jgi:riboflavin kinase/FMN adenylyltransferase
MEHIDLSPGIVSALSEGDILKANSLLGGLYTIKGTVVPGNQLGRTLGFPTANLRIERDRKPLIGYGVYAVFVKHESGIYQGVLNFGIRPTISGKMPVLEVHILRFSLDIYHQTLEISFLDRIRNEMKFNSLQDLKSQINCDIQAASALFLSGQKPDPDTINTRGF